MAPEITHGNNEITAKNPCVIEELFNGFWTFTTTGGSGCVLGPGAFSSIVQIINCGN
jgi:hypothetical protein